MSRSVDYNSNAVSVVYLTFQADDEYDSSWEWDEFIESIREAIQSKYQSFEVTDSWAGRELRTILESDFAEVQVAEYCGLVSVSLVANDEDDEIRGLAENWTNSISANFSEHLNKTFNGLRLIARASNGEAFYERAA